ncbi:PqiC family protein [Chrysiogenes arsenatis]|uniref:PqiC family protein n=1 Tax=Chrysiogenes arsenatis TaxID=309797 RepID=UPI00040A4EB4|nr:PqiC family protein [Chrysiogenes arsenatis]
MKKTRNWLFALIASLGFLSGCATTPPASFYTLNPLAMTHEQVLDVALLVERVTIPPTIDRPQMVRQHGADQVVFDEFHRWAAPLRYEMTRVIAMNLATLLGTSRVGTYPETTHLRGENNLYRVQVDATRIAATLGEAVLFDATWRVYPKDAPVAKSGRTNITIPTTDSSNNALAAAYSEALLRVSHDISLAIRELQQNP